MAAPEGAAVAPASPAAAAAAGTVQGAASGVAKPATAPLSPEGMRRNPSYTGRKPRRAGGKGGGRKEGARDGEGRLGVWRDERGRGGNQDGDDEHRCKFVEGHEIGIETPRRRKKRSDQFRIQNENARDPLFILSNLSVK